MIRNTKKIVVIASVAGALLLATAGARIADAQTLGFDVSLKSRAIVSGDKVHLSDLFHGVPSEKDTAIAAAPIPGRRLLIHTRKLADLAHAHELGWKPRHSRERVLVERATRLISAVAIRDEIESELINRLPGGEIEVELSNPRLSIEIAEEAPSEIKINDLTFDRRGHRFSAMVTAGGENSEIRPVRVTGRVHDMITVPVLARHVGAGELISEDDIAWQSVRARRNGFNTVTDIKQLLGRKTRRPIMAGRAIRRTDVVEQLLVARGDLVTVVYRSGPMTLTMRGRALERGAKGATVRLRNLTSKKVLFGVVTGPSQVVVKPNQLAALN